MVRNPWRFVIVNGYGTHLKPELKEYLNGTRWFVNRVGPAYLIFCGAETQRKTAPGVTEALLMARYVLDAVPQEKWPEVILDVNSFTTLEDVLHAVHHIRAVPGIEEHWAEVEVDVFCEASRSLKVLILYWLALPEIRRKPINHRVKVRTSSWELSNPLLELLNIAFDVAAIYVPGLAAWARRRRIRRSAKI